MAFRKRSVIRPSSSRASNKMRLNAKGGTAEIESWVSLHQITKAISNNSIRFLY